MSTTNPSQSTNNVVPPTPLPSTGNVAAPSAPATMATPVVAIKLETAQALFTQLVPKLKITGIDPLTTTWFTEFFDTVTSAITSVCPTADANSYLGLCLPTEMSTVLLGKAFVFPTQPNLTPNFVSDQWDDAGRQAELAAHRHSITKWQNVLAFEQALQALIMEVVPYDYFPDTFVRPPGLTTLLWPPNYHVFNLIDDLFTTWNHPTEDDELLHRNLFDSTWSLSNTTLMAYFDAMERARLLAALMKNPYTDRQLVVKAYAEMKRTVKLSGPFSVANTTWQQLSIPLQTWTTFRTLFGNAYKICLQKRYVMEPATQAPAFPEGAFAVHNVQAPDSDDEDSIVSLVTSSMANMLTTALDDRLAVQEARHEARMQAFLSQQQVPPTPYVAPLPSTATVAPPSYTTTTGRIPPPAPAVPPLPTTATAQPTASTPTTTGNRDQNRVKKYANHLFCASCGCDVDHSSPNCPKKRRGHDDRVIHKEQAKQIRDADNTLKMPCLRNYRKTLWPM